ncbi:hypothetical protein QBC98_000096 [Kitasatospora acidiphila]
MKSMRKATKTVIAGAAAAAAVVGLSGTASANDVTALYQGDTLYVGDSVDGYGASGQTYQLTMQSDGNLVEYRWDNGSRRACWATNTMGSTANRAVYQPDGNFVVYTPGNFAPWSSHTVGDQGSTININSHGALWVGYTQIFGGC